MFSDDQMLPQAQKKHKMNNTLNNQTIEYFKLAGKQS